MSKSDLLHGFPLIESARLLCSQHAHGIASVISWDALTAPEPPEEIALFYIERLGTEALEKGDGEWTWRLPAGAPQPDHVLSLHPVTADGPWKQCDEPVPADAQTILLLATIHRWDEPKI